MSWRKTSSCCSPPRPQDSARSHCGSIPEASHPQGFSPPSTADTGYISFSPLPTFSSQQASPGMVDMRELRNSWQHGRWCGFLPILFPERVGKASRVLSSSLGFRLDQWPTRPEVCGPRHSESRVLFLIWVRFLPTRWWEIQRGGG